MTIAIGTKGTTDVVVHNREGESIITRAYEVIEWTGEGALAANMYRVIYTDHTASTMGTYGFLRIES